MAEIKLFYHKDGVIRLSRSLDFLKSNPIQSFLWIDLNDVDEEVENELEDFLKIYIQEEEEMIENMTHKITQLSNSLSLQEADKELLGEIKNLQEKTMMLRENIIDKQRTVSSMLRSDFISKELQPKLSMMIRDINSLVEHIKFSFDRLDYLQDTFLGYVNIEQNKIIKIFTIVSVIFMPPTLIASIYGMNFTAMPELKAEWGYPVSIGMMVLSSLAILLYFKKKKWL